GASANESSPTRDCASQETRKDALEPTKSPRNAPLSACSPHNSIPGSGCSCLLKLRRSSEPQGPGLDPDICGQEIHRCTFQHQADCGHDQSGWHPMLCLGGLSLRFQASTCSKREPSPGTR